jgi:hypothetical protein
MLRPRGTVPLRTESFTADIGKPIAVDHARAVLIPCKFRTTDENKTCLRQAILTLVSVGKVSAIDPCGSDWRLRKAHLGVPGTPALNEIEMGCPPNESSATHTVGPADGSTQILVGLNQLGE